MLKNNRWAPVVLCIIFLSSITGCEKISGFVEYFSPKKPKPPVTATPKSGPGPIPAQSIVAPAIPPQSATTEPKELPNNVLAKVGNWTLTIEEFKERLNALKEMVPDFDVNDPDAKKMILEELIRQQLLVEEGEKTGVANKKDVMMAVEEFKRTLLVREVANNIVKNIQVTDQEAEEYYNQNKSEFVERAQWRLSEIVVDTEEVAKEILIEILKDADFAEMAKQKSKGKTAAEGGDLGFMVSFEFPQLEKAVEGLEVGKVSGVFQGPKGFYIVKLTDKQGGEQREFAGIKDDIKNGLTMLKQQQAIVKYLDELRQKATVYVNEKLLEL